MILAVTKIVNYDEVKEQYAGNIVIVVQLVDYSFNALTHTFTYLAVIKIHHVAKVVHICM